MYCTNSFASFLCLSLAVAVLGMREFKENFASIYTKYFKHSSHKTVKRNDNRIGSRSSIFSIYVCPHPSPFPIFFTSNFQFCCDRSRFHFFFLLSLFAHHHTIKQPTLPSTTNDGKSHHGCEQKKAQ